MAKRLDGKIALVTGASRGIGRAVALALADEGAHVIAAARTDSDLQSLAREIEAKGVRALPVAGDLTQTADVDRLAAEAQQLGAVDILVNNAGVGKFGTLDTLSAEDYDWMMNTNMRATFLCTRAFFP